MLMMRPLCMQIWRSPPPNSHLLPRCARPQARFPSSPGLVGRVAGYLAILPRMLGRWTLMHKPPHMRHSHSEKNQLLSEAPHFPQGPGAVAQAVVLLPGACAEMLNPKSWSQELSPKPQLDQEERRRGEESHLHLPNAVRIVVTAAATGPEADAEKL